MSGFLLPKLCKPTKNKPITKKTKCALHTYVDNQNKNLHFPNIALYFSFEKKRVN